MSVEPIYIHGLNLTGSSPSRTLICDASYSCTFFGSAISEFKYKIYNGTLYSEIKLECNGMKKLLKMMLFDLHS
jgi:hypothetical protein